MDSEIKNIMDALSSIYISDTLNEFEIHKKIEETLQKNNIRYKHEYKLLTRKRFDFWINGIVLEIKKRKPSKISLLNQLDRYTKVPAVKAIIIVLERNINIPDKINGKPIFVKSLYENWGITI